MSTLHIATDSGPHLRSLAALIAELEREAIRNALARYHGNLTCAAYGLGIGRMTMYRKVRKHGLSGMLEECREERRND